MVYSLTLGAILSVTTLRGSPEVFHSHLDSSLSLIKKRKEKFLVSFFSSLGMVNGNVRDCVDSVAETTVFTKPFPFLPGHTCRKHFPTSLAVKGCHVKEVFQPSEVGHFQADSIKTSLLLVFPLNGEDFYDVGGRIPRWKEHRSYLTGYNYLVK